MFCPFVWPHGLVLKINDTFHLYGALWLRKHFHTLILFDPHNYALREVGQIIFPILEMKKLRTRAVRQCAITQTTGGNSGLQLRSSTLSPVIHPCEGSSVPLKSDNYGSSLQKDELGIFRCLSST